MDGIIGGRRTGKTYRVVQWYKEDPERRYIIVAHQAVRRTLIDDYDVNPHHILSAATAAYDRRGLPMSAQYAIDNLDAYLAQVEGFVPDLVSFTGVGTLLMPNPEVGHD